MQCWFEKCEYYDSSNKRNCKQWMFPDEDCIIYSNEDLKLCYINNMKWEAVLKYVDREDLL